MNLLARRVQSIKRAASHTVQTVNTMHEQTTAKPSHVAFSRRKAEMESARDERERQSNAQTTAAARVNDYLNDRYEKDRASG